MRASRDECLDSQDKGATLSCVAGQSTSGYRERNSTADRALDILGMFTDARPTIGAGDVADHLGVARSTAYRYVQSLVRSGFLEEAEMGRLRLGRRILELAIIARRGLGLSDVARPVMRRLCADLGETILLTRLAGNAVVCLEREEASTQRIRISYERGQLLHINAAASAFVLLAWLHDHSLDPVLRSTPLERFTGRTLTSPSALRRRLAETAKQGFGLSQGELDENVLGVGAPIRDADDVVRAAISVAAFSTRMPKTRLPGVIGKVRAAADEISAALAQLG
jgi:DNA-binding IclR family transcriptional regulator